MVEWCIDCNNKATNCVCDIPTIRLPEPILKVLFDLAVGSLDFGSGFWEREDIDSVRFVAQVMGICPQAATPSNDRRFYPECEGTKLAQAKVFEKRKSWGKPYEAMHISDVQVYDHEDHEVSSG